MMKTLALAFAAAWLVCLSAAAPAHAAILAYYPLGEAGSLGASNTPLDTLNGHDFLNPIGSATVVAPGGGGAPGSTSALSFTPNQGYFYEDSDTDFVPADNFRVELWAKPASSQISNFFTLGELNGAVTIGITTDGVNDLWFAGANNVNWIGAAGGAGQPATLNVWTKLAVEQVGGVMTFYINGVAQSPTLAYSNPAANGGKRFHIGVVPGGTNFFNGALDELKISAIPEPSGALLLGMGVLAFVRVAGRRNRKSS